MSPLLSVEACGCRASCPEATPKAEGKSKKSTGKAKPVAQTTEQTVEPVQPEQEPQQASPAEQPTAQPGATSTAVVGRDPRLLPVGSVISRKYKGETLHVTVLQNGFLFEGETFTSLSRLAKVITGHQAVIGYAFFKLGNTGKAKWPGLAAKIARIEGLVAKLKAALEDGAKAVEEAEEELAEMKEEAE